MGLSGRKVKQRISQDPRNLSWADDAARFGSNYLSKFGWDASKGLGAGGDGRTSHIKVDHKLDMLGIGAAHQKDPNGIAWKQNKDFENLLKRLNEPTIQNTPDKNGDEEIEADVDMHGHKEKRKHKDGEDGSERKKKRKRSRDHEEAEDSSPQPLAIQWDEAIEGKTISVEVKKSDTYLPRHRAHRARAIAAKNMSSKSSVHISEILGVAPTNSIPSQDSTGETSQDNSTYAEGLENSKITTSIKSLADYFKEKLNARSKTADSTTSSSSSDNTGDNDFHDITRMGLGSSRLRLEAHSETRVAEETQRVGLSKFSSLMSSSFLTATSSFSSHVAPSTEKEEKVEDARIAQITEVQSELKESKKKQDKKVKKKKISNDGPQQGNGEELKKGKREGGEEKPGEKDGAMDEEENQERRKERRNRKKKKRELESQSATYLVKEQEIVSAIQKVSRKQEKEKQKTEKPGVLANEGEKEKIPQRTSSSIVP